MSSILIQNVVIHTSSESIYDHDVLINNGRIHAITPASIQNPPPEAQIINADGRILTPGLVDLQLNGGFGHDFTQSPETIWRVAAELPQFGVTAFLPTIITSPLSQIAQAQAVLAAGPPPGFRGAMPLGLHVEGPFLNPAKKGAHNPSFLQPPNLSAVADWTPAIHVRLVTLAPELEGATAVIKRLVENGVIVSAGHSMADLAAAEAGIDAGIRYGTHLFNAMPSLHHRDPGLIAALLADERITIGLIPDGVHVHPALVKVIWQAARGRVNLVTDAMAAMGMPPGRYVLGSYRVVVGEDGSRLEDGTLAGSIVPLDAAVRRFKAFTGCSTAEALQTVTSTPTRLLGLNQQKGEIKAGLDADLVLLNDELKPEMTIIGGEIVFEKEKR